MHRPPDQEELTYIYESAREAIEQGLLMWMDMGEAIKEDAKHEETCDGACSHPFFDSVFDLNRKHIDRVIESFRDSLKELIDKAIEHGLTSDASELS